MPEQLLNLLKICLLVLLYLFFLRVLRAVWAEVSALKSSGATAGHGAVPVWRRRAPLEGAPRPPGVGAAEWRGRAMAMAPHVTIGRDPDSTLPIADNYLSHQHARIVERDGDYLLEDLGSTNGTYLNGKRMTAPAPLRRGDRVQAGNLVVEVT
ncbi:MAG: FHA domain-containing protein [Microthrixaceae bacterium]